jgi:hypothetical protein
MIDFSFIGAATTSLSAARDIARSLIEIRDFNHLATIVSSLNEQILKAQDSLLAHNAQLFTLQQENFELANKLARAEEKLADRGRYTLVEISDRTFVMGLNKRIEAIAQDLVNGLEINHYLCQPCFDKGIKAVLKRFGQFGAISLRCPIRDTCFDTGKTEPFVG